MVRISKKGVYQIEEKWEKLGKIWKGSRASTNTYIRSNEEAHKYKCKKIQLWLIDHFAPLPSIHLHLPHAGPPCPLRSVSKPPKQPTLHCVMMACFGALPTLLLLTFSRTVIVPSSSLWMCNQYIITGEFNLSCNRRADHFCSTIPFD